MGELLGTGQPPAEPDGALLQRASSPDRRCQILKPVACTTD
jgi:hypothetical protein